MKVVALMNRWEDGRITATPYLHAFGRSWRIGKQSVAVLPDNVSWQRRLRQVGERKAEQSAYDPRFHVAPSEDAQREQQGNDEADDRGDKEQE